MNKILKIILGFTICYAGIKIINMFELNANFSFVLGGVALWLYQMMMIDVESEK